MAEMPALDPARSVSLQASAGSGKTWQLVSRIVRLLLEGAEPGGIIALTFTRKAAVEMRLRLNERLRRLSLAATSVAPSCSRWWAACLPTLPNPSIATVAPLSGRSQKRAATSAQRASP